jgi:hypothetical protein
MDAPDRVQRVSVLALAVGAALLLGVPPAAAQSGRGTTLQPPELIQLRGHVGEPFAGETGSWNLELGFGFSPTIYHYHLYDLRVVNSGRLGEEILFAVAATKPNFYLFGTPDQMAKLASATPQEMLTITGWRRAGSRTLSITEVALGPLTTPTPAPTPAPSP